jgi:hypothetical protein
MSQEEQIAKAAGIIVASESGLEGLRINVLRPSSSTIEYEIRKKGHIGFSIIQTHPQQKILKVEGIDELTAHRLLRILGRFNMANKRIVKLLDFQREYPEIVYITEVEQVSIVKLRDNHQNYDKECRSIAVFEGSEWCYRVYELH